MKSICFILPKFARKPIGGFKMVFEYANRLNNLGHDVTILFLNDKSFETWKIPVILKRIAANLLTRIEPRWFKLNKKINKISGTSIGFQNKIKNVDVAIATAVDTVSDTNILFPNIKKIYFIQDYEDWIYSKEIVQSTYSIGFVNIVISEWLKKIVDRYAINPSILIKNSIDVGIYRCKVPIQKRNNFSLAFLYHSGKHKGAIYAFKAIAKLKEKYPNLEVYSFGTSKKPSDMPSYVNYFYCASQNQTVDIYNKVAVFLCSTVAEGYGLTGLEAMACGAVLVSTDYCGVREYAVDKKNALLSPIKDIDALVANISRVFDDDFLRFNLSEAGINSVKNEFNWNMAVDKFNSVIND